MGFQGGVASAAFAAVGLGSVHEAGAEAAVAQHFGNPEPADVQPAAPDVAGAAAEPLAALAAEEEADGEPFGQAGFGEAEVDDVVFQVPLQVRVGQRFEDDPDGFVGHALNSTPVAVPRVQTA